jgi:NitT/TauT family transport system substrate-binding protein
MRASSQAAVLALSIAFGWAAPSRAEDVNVGIIGSGTDAPFFIAEAKGYFKDEGLTVKLVQFDSGAKMTAPLAVGELDAGAGAASVGLYNAAAQGVIMKIVADKVQYGTTYNHASLLVRKALVESGGFKGYADLKGLKVAITARGSSDESVLNEALKRGGLKWGDAQPIYLGFAQHLPAFANGAIDASLTAEPLVTAILKSGVAVRFVSNDKFYPRQQSAVLIYGSLFIKNRPETARKFMRAYIRAARFYNDAVANASLSGPTAPEVIAILARYSTLKDPKIYGVITPSSIDPDGKLNLESLRKDWQFFRDTGQIDGKITPDDVVDMSFAESAVASLGPYRPAVLK